ncbi:MAG: DNA methyltransferase [Lachnospiraceae bacterium]|nr:DNA methyltransferase [Anaerostipes sp.]MDD3617483.1 DNA methyltransferase [Lachnospiraceae bacterium]
MNNIKKLFEQPLQSTRTGAFFNAFPYPTKISPESIAVYIATVTKPNDTVLDVFGGSGSTSIASLLCEYPTEKMIKMANDLNVTPTWGKRDAISYEIGSYGSFAAKTITNRIKADEFKSVVDEYVTEMEKELNPYYETFDEKGNKGIIRYVIWTEYLLCTSCGKEISYFQEGTERNPVKFKKHIKCPFCNQEHLVDDLQFATENYYDELVGEECVRKKREPAWVYGTTGGKNWNRKANIHDIEMVARIEHEQIENDYPKKIIWGDLHRSGYHFGISYLHQFYTKRNYIVMKKLWDKTDEYPEKIRDSLRLLLLSYNSTHCTLMTRVVAKKNAKDFALTGAQSGVLYISKVPVEKNILLGLRRKASPFIEAYRMLEKCTGIVNVHNLSSEKIVEKNNSVDFIFTDPPFGDFIPYAEVNQINELWLPKVTERKNEIIISNAQEKNLEDYQKMLVNVFSEMNRVLKVDSYAAVVFHAAKAQIWTAFENVIADACFQVCFANILDKKQASFKQIVSDGSVQGDPIFLLKDRETKGKTKRTNKKILDQVINDNNEQCDERRLYSLYINECLKEGEQVRYDAKEAYQYIKMAREG